MDILQSLCSVPTAPFAEDRVVQFITQFVAERPRLSLESDAAGNLLIALRSRGRLSRSFPRWVFTAHMDHPGFIAGEVNPDGTLHAHFRGYVEIPFFAGVAVHFFDGDRVRTGTVISAATTDPQRGNTPTDVTIAIKTPPPPGTVGMFAVGPGRYQGRRYAKQKFLSRVCDDLAGAAACLAMLEALIEKPPTAPVAVLLTRGEEEGFVGAVAACEKPTLLKKTDRIIAIETSAAQLFAPQGGGAIVRIGDRSSIFNSSLSAFLVRQAEALKKTDKTFAYQRALMPGGTCEATVYDLWGYHAASICVALGNYHNMDRIKKKIAPEMIDVADWKNMVKLFIAVARTGHDYQPGQAELKSRILKRFDQHKALLAPAKSNAKTIGRPRTAGADI